MFKGRTHSDKYGRGVNELGIDVFKKAYEESYIKRNKEQEKEKETKKYEKDEEIINKNKEDDFELDI